MMYDKNSIEKSYAVMKEFYEVVNAVAQHFDVGESVHFVVEIVLGGECACCHACRIDRVTFVTRPVLQI